MMCAYLPLALALSLHLQVPVGSSGCSEGRQPSDHSYSHQQEP